ncbi:MAG: hypothetical protein NTW03_05375 [Verrucomicrobia bacterium]|nr:hypothetical protein [Verrucomicrobiota bacterium]
MKRIAILFLIVAVLVVMALFLHFGASKQPSFLLSSGASVKFEGCTFGPVHRRPQWMWTRWLRFLPSSLRKVVDRFGVPTWGVGNGNASPSLMIWFTRTGAPLPSRPGAASRDWFCTIVHEDGFESPLQGEGTSVGLGTSTNSTLGSVAAYPRRAKYIRFRFYDRPSGQPAKVLGEFVVRNPHRVKEAPSWTPHALPATNRNDDFEVILRELETGIPLTRLKESELCTRVVVWLRDTGSHASRWHLKELVAEDATGNRLRLHATATTQRVRDEGLYEFSPPLWPSETYRLRMEVVQTPALLLTSEIWTITNLALPTNGTSVTQALTAVIDGLPVKFYGISTPGNSPWGGAASGSLSADFDVPSVPDRNVEVFRISDEHGHQILEQSFGWRSNKCRIGLRPPADATRVSLRIGFPRRRFVEYMLRPTFATNLPSRN